MNNMTREIKEGNNTHFNEAGYTCKHILTKRSFYSYTVRKENYSGELK
jgi:hypothetical protein